MSIKDDFCEEEISRIDPEINEQLNNIAANIGISKTQLLKGYFREIRDKEEKTNPEHLEPKKPHDKIKHIKVSGYSRKLREELAIIATHYGLTKNSFYRLKLHQLVDGYPKQMRKKPPRY